MNDSPVSDAGRRRRERGLALVPAVFAASVVTMSEGSVHTTFNARTLGNSLIGRVCFWTNSNYAGNPGATYGGTVASMNVTAKSRGSWISNRGVAYLRNGVVFATGGPNTGNTQSTNVTTTAIDISVCGGRDRDLRTWELPTRLGSTSSAFFWSVSSPLAEENLRKSLEQVEQDLVLHRES